MIGSLVPAAVLAAVLWAAGCGDDRGESRSASDPRPEATAERLDGSPPPRPIEPVRCPKPDAGCRRATGEIVYVERIDPDGEGDAHFVVLSEESVTAPGISVIDVGRELRPHPLPEPGETISAAGPVLRGSYGQRQIEAIRLRVAP